MDIFLIDFENVKSEGLNGILSLAKTDLVCVFWSLKEDKLKIETTEQLMKCQVPVYFYKADVGGKNALDHQLSSYLGYLIGKGSDAHYYIISNDKGYRFLADFWKRMKVDAPIELAPSIKAVKVRQQQQQQRQQALFNEPRVERIAQKESPKLLPVKEAPAEEPIEVPEGILTSVAEEAAPMVEPANVPAEAMEERTSRKKRRGHRSRRRPKPVETTVSQEIVEVPAEETPATEETPIEVPAEGLPDAEVVLEIPSEGIIAEVTMEEAPVEEPVTEVSLEEPAEIIAAEEEELPDAEVVLEIPAEGIVAEVTLEETPVEEGSAKEVPAQETPEENAPKKSRNRSSRNRRSRAKKQEAAKEEVVEAPAAGLAAEDTPAEQPVEIPVEPIPEATVESANAEPAQEQAETPAKKPAKRSRKKPAKKQNTEPKAEATVEKPAAVPAEPVKEAEIPMEKANISMDALIALIPDSKEEAWVPALLEDINASHNKKELYAKVIRRLRQEHGRDIYHKIKKLVP